MSEMNRQQICAALDVSESTIRRLEQFGLPYTPVGKRSKRYNLDECKAWLRQNESLLSAEAKTPPTVLPREARAFTESFKNVRLRVIPSEK